MAEQGIVSFTAGIQSTPMAYIDDAWTKDIEALSPQKKLFIRAEVSARDSDDVVPVDAYKRAFSVWQKHGFEVIPSLHGGITHPYRHQKDKDAALWSPNAPLGYQSNPLSNHYIEAYSTHVVKFLRDLGDACPTRLWLWNEPNLASIIKPGDNCPPNASKKWSSLSPQVYMSLIYTTALRIRDAQHGAPAVQHIWPGPLSCLAQYHTDPNGPWEGTYLRQGLDYLKEHGVNFSHLPFEGLWVNMEGEFDDDYAHQVAVIYRKIIEDYALRGPFGCGEWSIGSGRWDTEKMRTTFNALNKETDIMACFQHPAYRDYGLSNWGVTKDGVFTVHDHLPAYDDLKNYLSTVKI